MSNFQKQKEHSEIPENYPAEIFIDFILTQGYEVVEDTPTYTIVKNPDKRIIERICESERDLTSARLLSYLADLEIPVDVFINYLREMDAKVKSSVDFFIDRSFIELPKE